MRWKKFVVQLILPPKNSFALTPRKKNSFALEIWKKNYVRRPKMPAPPTISTGRCLMSTIVISMFAYFTLFRLVRYR